MRGKAGSGQGGRRAALPVFFILLVALSAIFWWMSWLAASGTWHPSGPRTRDWIVTGLMWCPGIAALIACAWSRTGFDGLGLGLPRGRWLALGYLYPVAYLLVAYAIVWVSGFGAFDTTMLAEDAGKRYALPAGLSPVLVATVATATVGVLVEIGRSLGEELGWRGFLSPALSAKRGLEFGGLASGAIWGLWHVPLFIAIGFGTLPAGYALACFLVSTTSLGYVCAWLRWRSRSVWPAVVLHAVHNALLYPVLEMVTAPDGDRTQYATGETGFALAVVNLVGALLVWRSRRQGAQPSPDSAICSSS